MYQFGKLMGCQLTEISMPFVYRGSLAELENSPLVEGGDCVALIKAKVPGLRGISTRAWRQGITVVGSTGIEPGTAIATFEFGEYPSSRDVRKHAAIFLGYGGNALWVIDQWKNDPAHPKVQRRLIYPGQKNKNGTFVNPSNNSFAFSVIELK